MTETTITPGTDPAEIPDGLLAAFDPSTLDMTANARGDAEATVTAEDVAGAKALAVNHEYRCGNAAPAELRRLPDGRLRVRDGHRRTIMCQRAEVPLFGFINGTDSDEQADVRSRLLTQWFSNHHREDFTRSADAGIMLTLFDTGGMTEAGIAKALGVKRNQVKTWLKVARSPLASALAGKYEFLTMDQAAAIDQFDTDADAEAVKALVAAARDGRFDSTLARLLDHREQIRSHAAFVAGLTEAGYHVYGERPLVSWTMALENLRTPEGEPISVEEHASCPGRAVTIGYGHDWAPGAEQAWRDAHGLGPDDDLDTDAVPDKELRAAGWGPAWVITRHLCTDPDQYGHGNVHGAPDDSAQAGAQQQAQTEADKAALKAEERRRVIARNKLWRAATVVRRKHVAGFLAARRLPRALRDPVIMLRAEAVTRNHTQPQTMGGNNRVAARLLGLDSGYSATDAVVAAITGSAPARVEVIELGVILGAAEHDCGGEDGTDAETWRSAEASWFSRSGTDRRVRYLRWLVAHTGYDPSQIETEVMIAGTPPAVTPPGDGDDGWVLDLADGHTAASAESMTGRTVICPECGREADVTGSHRPAADVAPAAGDADTGQGAGPRHPEDPGDQDQDGEGPWPGDPDYRPEGTYPGDHAEDQHEAGEPVDG